jgi:hypothetical protein
MTTVPKQLLLIAVSLLTISPPAFAADANDPNDGVKFITASKAIAWQGDRGQRGQGPIQPEYAIRFFANQSKRLQYSNEVDTLLGTDTGKLLSPRQQEFLRTATLLCETGKRDEKMNGFYGITLFAVSEEDAKEMLGAYAEVMEAESAKLRQYYVKTVTELPIKIPEIQKQLAEKEDEYKIANENFAKWKKDTVLPYADFQGARESEKEYAGIVTTLEVDIKSKEARVNAIMEHQKKTGHSEVLMKLEQMLIDESVDLAGLVARRNAADSERLKALKKDLARKEEDLASEASYICPPEIYQVATIHPVQLL